MNDDDFAKPTDGTLGDGVLSFQLGQLYLGESKHHWVYRNYMDRFILHPVASNKYRGLLIVQVGFGRVRLRTRTGAWATERLRHISIACAKLHSHFNYAVAIVTTAEDAKVIYQSYVAGTSYIDNLTANACGELSTP